MSDLMSAIEEYLKLRRSLGFRLGGYDDKLNDFAAFIQRQNSPVITNCLALAWAKQRPELGPASQRQRLQAVRGFTQYYRASHPETEVPPYGLLPGREHRKNPYLYSEEEVMRLMKAAQNLKTPRGTPVEHALRPWTYVTVLGLFVVTGLRLGEVLRLEQKDVDFSRALLTVRQTKFGKSRLVPLHETTVAALQSYASRRDHLHPTPRTPHFFVQQRGGRLDTRTFKTTFIQLSCQVGLRGKADRHGPRIHDFRHSFAVNTVVRWYEQGADVARLMPILSTFLGHAHVADTYWYLTASPKLLSLAGARLESLMEVLS